MTGPHLANNPGATEAAAQASALGVLAWIGVAGTLVTLVVALMLRKPVESAGQQLPASDATAPAASN